jgi:phosphatidyl-myo-inositol dimannoside synthase
MNHLLVTNDFPPKVGGIQSYLWELWRRLPPEQTTVFTTRYEGDTEFDRRQAFRIERGRRRVLLPTPALIREVNRLADEVDAALVVLDPAFPLASIGPSLHRPYGVVVHGAEVTAPRRIPGASRLLRRALLGASLVVVSGGYPAAEAERAAGRRLPSVPVPPGVDTSRFRPLSSGERREVRLRLGVPEQAPLVVSVSRLVPRKGMDVLIEAAAELRSRVPDLQVLIAGHGRDRARLERLIARTGSPTRLLGKVPDDDLPSLLGCADVFAMLCRNRWAGLEQEGFGIVFLEAAACGVAQIAGRSGGSHEAVDDGVTGLVVDDPRSVPSTVEAIGSILADRDARERLGRAARLRAEQHFTYDGLAAVLRAGICSAVESPGGTP